MSTYISIYTPTYAFHIYSYLYSSVSIPVYFHRYLYLYSIHVIYIYTYMFYIYISYYSLSSIYINLHSISIHLQIHIVELLRRSWRRAPAAMPQLHRGLSGPSSFHRQGKAGKPWVLWGIWWCHDLFLIAKTDCVVRFC